MPRWTAMCAVLVACHHAPVVVPDDTDATVDTDAAVADTETGLDTGGLCGFLRTQSPGEVDPSHQVVVSCGGGDPCDPTSWVVTTDVLFTQAEERCRDRELFEAWESGTEVCQPGDQTVIGMLCVVLD